MRTYKLNSTADDILFFTVIYTTRLPLNSHSSHISVTSVIKHSFRLNRIYNRYRNYRGQPYYSISKVIKAKVKRAVNFISNFEEKIVELAKARNCDGVICGHIHTPADKIIDGVHYLNSGDWVESMTAIVEHMDGKVEVLEYNDFLKILDATRQHEPIKINDKKPSN